MSEIDLTNPDHVGCLVLLARHRLGPGAIMRDRLKARLQSDVPQSLPDMPHEFPWEDEATWQLGNQLAQSCLDSYGDLFDAIGNLWPLPQLDDLKVRLRGELHNAPDDERLLKKLQAVRWAMDVHPDRDDSANNNAASRAAWRRGE